MKLSRRQAIAVGVGAGIFALMPHQLRAAQEEGVAAFTGGVEPKEGDITLNAPEIAENGNTVPISVDAPGAEEVMVFALGNPSPDVVKFKFGRLAGSHTASTRIRLAKTQNVVAVAKMPDGSFVKTQKEVKVTIGGCGG
ncbi:thiosulfate oxidation carrier protein SoxY [Dichotomicrobium thermohalophilum]|uniref:Sulfur-oxidizing protein SoxY n=1 Tax=Dichotomicrobium thermohalophilum TaxID=933063 RepID=A0A397QDA0_9HYPH|nr:thiosulfate oxidation carrier protein SoxY [Dichotomicrobium thermohalophilum]RIA56064.1 sulfur-oxidizing protein SoxY [Dichotomicrobium thermohalophilum]